MIKYLLKIFLLFIGFSAMSQTFEIYEGDTVNRRDAENKKQGLWIVKDKSGVVSDKGKYVGNKKEGIWLGYYASGKIKHEITYKKNRPDGYAKFYYEDGTVSEEGNWKINKWVGDYKYFHTNGNLAYDFKYNENGKRTGEQKYYYSDGSMMYKGDWKAGKKEGVLTEYYPDGSVKSEMSFAEGKVNLETIKEYSVAEKPATKVVAPKLQEVKAQTTTNANSGEPKKQSEAIDIFNRTGTFKTYNEFKKLDREGDFVKGRLMDGKRYLYDEQGNLTKTLFYKGGSIVKVEEAQ
jgi:antitoxin component YwqK of YwqJK toxin-antitoxin module